MKDYILDGYFFKNKTDSHKYLKEVFSFPDYYGENLDALWDLLNDLDDCRICINNHEKIVENLGEYGKAILEIFNDLKSENRIEIILK